MSDEKKTYHCDYPHHGWQSERALNAEVASWHLRGLAMILDGLAGLREHSTFDRLSEMGANMVMTDTLRRLAETLEPPDLTDTGTPDGGTPEDADRPRPSLTVVDGGQS